MIYDISDQQNHTVRLMEEKKEELKMDKLHTEIERLEANADRSEADNRWKPVWSNSPKPICGGIPGFLIYPNDPLSQIMFGSQMQKVRDKRCGYQFMLYTDIADPTPEIRQQNPPFDINETHIFWNPDSSAFCAVSTMKAPSVKTSDLRNWVEMNDQMGMLFGDMKPFLNLPSGLANGEYRRVELHDMGQSAAYNKLHGFEEIHVWCHVFYLGDTLYKKFILCAKRDNTSWKAECTFPSDSEALQPTDAVPPGQIFGSFFPAE